MEKQTGRDRDCGKHSQHRTQLPVQNRQSKFAAQSGLCGAALPQEMKGFLSGLFPHSPPRGTLHQAAVGAVADLFGSLCKADGGA